MKFAIAFILAATLAVPLCSAPDDIEFPFNFEELARRATETVDVTLDGSTLHLATEFLSKEDADEAQVKKLVSKLKGIYVRSFQFDKDGQYSMSDVEALRSQLKSPEWVRIVGVKSTKGENAGVFLHKVGNAIQGLVVIAGEPRELTIVHIDRPINPEELSELSGHMGILKIDSSGKKSKEE